MLNLLNKLRREKKGQDMVEYALLMAWIALIAVVGVTLVGEKVNAAFGTIAGKL